MNTAACQVSEVDVLPLELVVGSQPNETVGDSPPLSDVSLKVPSDRDLQIYEVVVFAGQSQRDVAREFGVSQPRVNQILKELAAWMADNTPNFCAGLTPEQKLRLVHYNVVQQLEHQRCVLMEAWEESRKGTETISRTSIVDGVRRTTAYNRPRSGKASFLNAASRISLAIAKLAGWTPRVVVPDAPQDSPWWRMDEESGEGRQEAIGSRQEVDESQVTLSPWEERAQDPNLTRADMDVLTAEQEAVCATLQAKIADLEPKIGQSKNTLSPGTGPLLPEGDDARDSTRRPRSGEERGSHAERGSQDKRREFLREENNITNIRDAFGRKTPLSG